MASKLKILYLSYWNSSDVLTKATVLPNLSILETLEEIEHLIWCNVERLKDCGKERLGSKITHIPLKSYTKKLSSLGQILDFIILPKLLKQIVSENEIDLIIARSSPAGALAYLVHKRCNIPYVVESFEPHSEYMRYSGVWNKLGLKYTFQKHWEKKQIETALQLITVSKNYKEFLAKSGSSNIDIKVVRCVVDLDKMSFSEKARTNIREELGWNDSIIGIYTGKLGGLYFEKESLLLFRYAFDEFGDKFRLIILSNQPKSWILEKLDEHKIPLDKTLVTYVEHELISNFLSAADFTFAPIKKSPVSKFCSPIKVGESWAIGLPVLLTEEIGDDSAIILEEGGGIVFTPSVQGLRNGIVKMKGLIESGINKKETHYLAEKYRSLSFTRNTYIALINKMNEAKKHVVI